MDMIERMARALVAAITKQDEEGGSTIWHADYGPQTSATEALVVDGEICPTEIVRALLQEMREPTEAMLNAAKAAGNDYAFGDQITWDEIPVMWRAMIDTLSSPPTSCDTM